MTVQVFLDTLSIVFTFAVIFGVPLSLLYAIHCWIHRGTNFNGAWMYPTYEGGDYVEFIDENGGLVRRKLVVQYRMMWFGNWTWLMREVAKDMQRDLKGRKVTNLRIGKFTYAV